LTPTPPKAPPAPPPAGKIAAPVPTVAVPKERLAQPLEARFPRLYNDFETVNTKGKIEDVFVPKTVPPTLGDVIHAVCQSHGTTDRGLIGDLNSSITEFLGVETVKQRAVPPPVVPPATPVKA
jgi:hypothetical protein